MTKAKPGDTIVYRTGKQLASEAKKHDFSDAVHLVRHYYNLGLINLCQTRLADGFFQYQAQKRGTVSPPAPAFSIDGYAVHKFRVPKKISAEA